MNDKNIIISVAALLFVVGAVLYNVSGRESPTADVSKVAPVLSSPVAVFAQCLKDSGTVYYGAFWCPHCQAQSALFGDAKALLPYVECSTPDGQKQTDVCIAKKIGGYPTWEFADGSRVSGEQTFAQLAEKSGCPAPPSE